MTRLKRIFTVGAIVLAIGATSITAYAVSVYNTPAEAVAGLTGKTVESVITEKSETGKTYGTIANENGKWAEFKTEMIKMKQETLTEKVAAGTMTQERANEMIAELEENQATCDGTGTARIGQNSGAGFGGMTGNGQGRGQGQGGTGIGRGNCGGNCQAQ